MVYPGQPSKGCKACKTRKIKCDEEKPACLQCRKTSRICPGYVDVIFRNQNEAVMKRSQKPKKPRAQKRATPPSDTAEPKDDLQSQLVITRQKSPASLPISQDLLVRLNQLRTHTLNISIQPPPWLSIQEQAVHVCFKNFDLLYGSYDAHNLLLALAPMYGASSERSPLRFATHAAALSVIAQLPSKRNLQHEAARTYGKAIKTMAVALQDPEQSQSNETVLATLLLSWYESISASNGSMLAWSNHIEGATEIVRLRGSGQFHDPLGLSLFRAIRTEMYINCLRQGKAPVDFPEVGGWLSDTFVGTYDYRDPAAQLMCFAVELPSLDQDLKRLVKQQHNPSAVAAMLALVERARTIDQNLMESNLPDEWRPYTVGYVSQLPQNIETADAWIGPIHKYADIYTASALNKLRCCRLLTSRVVTAGLKWAYPHDYLTSQVYQQAVYVEQQAIDEICSSLPSHFGWGEAEPANSGNEEMQHMADLISGYLLHWPLRVARSSSIISEYQRSWISHQLGDLAQRCGVQQASIPPPKVATDLHEDEQAKSK